jgi:apolipoprotein D and lipocalin family protein
MDILIIIMSIAAAPRTIQGFSVADYMGTWHEIARFPSWFEIGCSDVQATYTLTADGVHVRNACTYWGKRIHIDGTAAVVGDGKLQVSFFSQPLWRLFGNYSAPGGNYWIIATDYSGYALVGDRERKHLWVLSRQRRDKMTPDAYHRLLDMAAAEGFDTSRLEMTPALPAAASAM